MTNNNKILLSDRSEQETIVLLSPSSPNHVVTHIQANYCNLTRIPVW
jgi:hypothetical protein